MGPEEELLGRPGGSAAKWPTDSDKPDALSELLGILENPVFRDPHALALVFRGVRGGHLRVRALPMPTEPP